MASNIYGLLWEMYGMETLDTAKYEFYQLLDKFY
jgi:hypothetical protein